jgi:hypothetical protein
LERAKAALARLEAEVAASQRAADQLKSDLAKSRRNNKVRLRVTAVVMMTAALIKLTWDATHAPPPILPPATSTIPSSLAPHSGDSSDNAVEGSAPQALDRLRSAFLTMPDMDQLDIVREINRKHSAGPLACPLAWKDGVPSLSLGDQQGEAPTMAAALNRCASEVEKLRIERGTAKPK